MPILKTTKMYSPGLCGQNRSKIFVFGDNTIKTGKGGQACIRDCPNVAGVATKMLPTMEEKAFFSEERFLEAIGHIAFDLDAVDKHLKDGKDVIIPLDENGEISLGLGLAELDKRAPSVYAFICEAVEMLAEKYGVGEF